MPPHVKCQCQTVTGPGGYPWIHGGRICVSADGKVQSEEEDSRGRWPPPSTRLLVSSPWIFMQPCRRDGFRDAGKTPLAHGIMTMTRQISDAAECLGSRTREQMTCIVTCTKHTSRVSRLQPTPLDSGVPKRCYTGHGHGLFLVMHKVHAYVWGGLYRQVNALS